MPLLQTAQVANYDFGAPVAIGTVLTFTTKKGGRAEIAFENLGDAAATVSIEVSPDGVTYAATTDANNEHACTSLSVPVKQRRNVTQAYRQGLDNFIRVRALGGVRVGMQVRQDVGLDEVRT